MPADVGTLQTSMLEGRYRMLVDAITDYAIYMLDIGGHVSSWNAGAYRFKGYSEQEILGEHFSRFYGSGGDIGLGRTADVERSRLAAELLLRPKPSWVLQFPGYAFSRSVVLDWIALRL